MAKLTASSPVEQPGTKLELACADSILECPSEFPFLFWAKYRNDLSPEKMRSVSLPLH